MIFSKYGGLSLRESVREMSAPSKLPPKQHSPPGFKSNKDSGYDFEFLTHSKDLVLDTHPQEHHSKNNQF
jgi:hypothetical protein